MAKPSTTAVKTLFAHSRNICFFKGCEEKLTDPKWDQVNAEIAHIKGEKPGAARYDSTQTEEERQGLDNLLLLCPKHHKLIDRLEPDNYPVELLYEMQEARLGTVSAQWWCTEEDAERWAVIAIHNLEGPKQGELKIVRGRYGQNDTWVDVTQLVARAVVGDRGLAMNITNETMGGDPLLNVVKRLIIEYTLDGSPYEASFTEGQAAILP